MQWGGLTDRKDITAAAATAAAVVVTNSGVVRRRPVDQFAALGLHAVFLRDTVKVSVLVSHKSAEIFSARVQ